MKYWYASVNYGLETVISDVIKKRYNAQNVKILDSAIIFSCENEIKIKCINNLFIVLSSFHSGNISEAAKKIMHRSFTPPCMNGKTFRVIIMDCGKLRSIPQNIMNDIEENISRRTGLFPNRAKPDIEIWLNRRNDGATYFMVRVRKHSSFDKTLKQGELRPDIVDVMLHKAGIGKESVIADLFGGWGAIAVAAAESGQYKKIYTGDINEECVQYQKARLCKKQSCIVQKWDAHMLPLENESVDAVITDPPWGEYEKINTVQFYDKFISEAARILRLNGSLIFLSSAHAEAQDSLKKYNFDYTDISLKISGKDTYLFCAIRQVCAKDKGLPPAAQGTF